MSISPGTRFGRYEIRSRLGVGGMGEVYLAEDTQLDRAVAIKFLRAEPVGDEQARQRLIREAKTAATLDHPNICSIYETGEMDGRSFIAMQYVQGETLATRLQRKPMEIAEVLDIALQAADALSEAHARGIVHRDIKPTNVMMTARGQVKVMDFGLAKKADQTALGSGHTQTEQLLTVPGAIVGTVPYMSPEQVEGRPVDARSDIFSLGSMLYEMLSGRQPFVGNSSAATLSAILTQHPLPLGRYVRAMPAELERIVDKTLRKDREERYQTAKDLFIDLANVKNQLRSHTERDAVLGQSTGSTPATAQSRSSSKYWWVAAGVAGGAAAVLIASWLWLRQPGETTPGTSLKNVVFTQLTDQSGPEYFPALSPDGKSLIYASRAAGNWDIYAQRVGGRNPTNLTKDSPADDTQPSFSPDGERIAFRSEREGGGIYIMGATGESVIRVSDVGYTPAWYADGQHIVVATENIPQPSTRPTKSQLWTIDLKTGDRRPLTERDALQPASSPHGQRIAYWSRPSRAGKREEIWTMPAGGGEAVAVTDGATTDVNPIWSADGKHLYFTSNRGGSMNIWRVPIDEQSGSVLGQPEAVTTIGAATSPMHLSVSREGLRLVYAAQQETRNLRKVGFDPSAGKAVGEPGSITRGSRQFWFPDPSPDGEWLATQSMGNQRHILIMRPDGSGLRDLTDDAYTHYFPRWSPDGKRIAFSSRRTGNYEIWAINRDGSGLQQLTFVNQGPGAHYSVWSPDGNRMAYSIHTPRNDGVIFVPGKAWNEQKLEYLTSLDDSSLSFEIWSWSPDGKKLAGVRHLPSGAHAGIGVYDLESKTYDWLTDFGDWPLWLNDNRHLIMVNRGKILLIDSRTSKVQPVLVVTDEDVDIGSPGLARDNGTIYFTTVAAEADVWLLSFEARDTP
ncbi:MAG TPA: protein kinase [Vicinamibacterales bacterium]|nr:protein kinase [Vicinamibacterales bacterium]